MSALESVRTVKLAAATPQVHAHLREVDGGRVDAAVREHRVQALLDGVPVVMVQCGVVAAWAGLLTGEWGLATALLVANAVSGFDWFGRVAGAVVTEAPGIQAWMTATSRLAGGGDLMDLPPGWTWSTAPAPAPATPRRDPLRSLALSDVSAVHDDGTLGVQDVDLERRAGELVLLLGQVGLRQVQPARGAGRPGQHHRRDPLERPTRSTTPSSSCARRLVSHVAQVPRVLSGTFTGNVALDHADRAGHAGARDGAGWVATSPRRAGRTRSSATAASASPAARCSASRWPGPVACDADLLLADDVSAPRSTRPPRSSCGRRCARGGRDRDRRDQQGRRPGAGRPGRRARRRDASWTTGALVAPLRSGGGISRAEGALARLVGWGTCASSSPEHPGSSAPT